MSFLSQICTGSVRDPSSLAVRSSPFVRPVHFWRHNRAHHRAPHAVTSAVARDFESGGDRNLTAEIFLSQLDELQSPHVRPGSEYGEGFFQYRYSGAPVHLDVDTLNEQLKVRGAHRHRHSFRPDEAIGCIFSWDDVIANTRDMQRRAWRRLADEEGLTLPALERRQMYSMRPERAIMDVLQWTRDFGRAQALAWRLALLYAEEFALLSEPQAGVREWLSALQRARVPCALVTTFDRQSVHAALERMGLTQFFQAKVTAEDGMETCSELFLSAAVKLARPPDHCVVFESSPLGITAAHNCTMRAVAVQGTHRGYELMQADLTCSTMTELSVYNMRRLFANRGTERMTIMKEGVGSRVKPRKLTNAVMDL